MKNRLLEDFTGDICSNTVPVGNFNTPLINMGILPDKKSTRK